jgi:nicotinamidase-related amidase
MTGGLSEANRSVLVVVDIQPSFLDPIAGKERVLRRSEFLLKIANLLEIPSLATEQYPSRMGGTHESLLPHLVQECVLGKMSFSCAGCSEFVDALDNLQRDQVVLVGIETHICVNQTAHHLLRRGYEVFLAADATGSRSDDAHKVGLKRMRQAGAVISHTESIVYEWMGSAEHPQFRDALKVVKEFSG